MRRPLPAGDHLMKDGNRMVRKTNGTLVVTVDGEPDVENALMAYDKLRIQ